MSDLMFMLDSHLSPDQNRALLAVQQAAAVAGANLFLTGGAMRDMLGGFPVRDLDFTVEADAVPLGRTLAATAGVTLQHADENRRRVELVFPGHVTVELGMARQETHPKPGGKPQVRAATIHEDLRWRDFTINAIALSVSRASRGLLLDPTNGRSDLDRRELRTVCSTALYDDPTRLLRLLRFRARLGFAVEERTRRQFDNALEAGLAAKVNARCLTAEVRHVAAELHPGDVLRAWEEAGLLKRLLPSADRLNLAGLAKMQRLRQLVPFGIDLGAEPLPLFLAVLAEPLTPKERAALSEALVLPPDEAAAWQKLPAQARRLERDLLSEKLHRPSAVYELLARTPGERVLYLLQHATSRLAQDRARNYLQKYLPKAQEIDEREPEPGGPPPGTPEYARRRAALIQAHLDSRPRKPAPPQDLALAAGKQP